MLTTCRSAYIHVPFCRHRCGYCNFTLIAGRDDLMAAYLEALANELEQQLVTPREVETIFLGGGTPTHLPPACLDALLSHLTGWLQPTPDAEFTTEANPQDCTPEKLEILRRHGVNRLSLGGQSFSNRKLATLERDHTGAQLQQALERAADFFPRTSLDLIFAAPDESLAEWTADLRQALDSPIQHLSTYGLTIERGSAFYGRSLRQDLVELDSDLQLDMYQLARSKLHDAGWEHYEVSNFSLPGESCRHNLAYWEGRPWWGFGPGAASFLPSESGLMVRAVNHHSTTNYIRRIQRQQSPIAESETLTREQRVRERLVFGLRRLAGVDFAELDQLFGEPARPLFEPILDEYVRQGWLEWQADRLRLTPSGLVISDGLWPDLLIGS